MLHISCTVQLTTLIIVLVTSVKCNNTIYLTRCYEDQRHIKFKVLRTGPSIQEDLIGQMIFH